MKKSSLYQIDEPPERHTNLTLASGLVVKQASKKTKEVKKGYWGDTVTGPYILYGFEYSTEVQMSKTKVEYIKNILYVNVSRNNTDVCSSLD